MAQFHYKARNSRGDSISGEIEGTSADGIATQLLNSGITPIQIDEVQPKQNILEELGQRLGAGKPAADDLILFCRQMYTLSRSGVPIIQAINGLADTAKNPMLSDTLRKMAGELESGRELSQSMASFPEIFSQLMVSLIQVGENTGKLDEAFLQLSTYLELDRDTRSRVKSALRYPSFVIVAIVIAIGIINTVVIPAFSKVFQSMNAELPWQTKLLIGVSDFTVNNWYLILAAIIIAITGVRYYINTDKGRYKWDRQKLRLPIIGSIILRATLSRFSRSFAMTTRSGVPLIQALTVVSKAVDNDYVTDRVLSMRNGIERGDTLTHTAATTSLFTPLVLQMMAVGEETGAVDQMMDEVAGFYEREVDYELKNLSSAIEPILIVAVGILVLILALAVFLPMWDISQLARS